MDLLIFLSYINLESKMRQQKQQRTIFLDFHLIIHQLWLVNQRSKVVKILFGGLLKVH